ncbi:hypothetical protein NC653_002580 [Populus alba x Populus x berolinensis]|uniref:Membrane insertase YidC/Oxa/ALB C-terminal domain-containing protein n=1 Tax=Populus alba x Populus x berolinensis TaxID=444605 RepID=A0AAD6RPH2_9ROSI|nr:hypothetical protein NC653_002580 [Populus alba x Populus x berolinensis]
MAYGANAEELLILGCFPTLATIPVWIGLYQALSNVANEGLLTEGFFWIPSLGGPTTIAARQSGSGISWLFPFVKHMSEKLESQIGISLFICGFDENPKLLFLCPKTLNLDMDLVYPFSYTLALILKEESQVDGHPPLGWHDTAAYLVLPVLLIASQYVSMEIMKPPQTDDPTQKNTLLVFKFLPIMIGYFSLSVPSGLSIYWFVSFWQCHSQLNRHFKWCIDISFSLGFTNNVLSTAQQVWLRKLGGAKPVVNENASGIITAGRAKRSASQPGQPGDRSVFFFEVPFIIPAARKGFKQLKEQDKSKTLRKALPTEGVQDLDSASGSDEDTDEETNDKEREGICISMVAILMHCKETHQPHVRFMKPHIMIIIIQFGQSRQYIQLKVGIVVIGNSGGEMIVLVRYTVISVKRNRNQAQRKRKWKQVFDLVVVDW